MIETDKMDTRNTHLHGGAHIYMTVHTFTWRNTHLHGGTHIYMTVHTFT
jgi:hypothetical protein